MEHTNAVLTENITIQINHNYYVVVEAAKLLLSQAKTTLIAGQYHMDNIRILIKKKKSISDIIINKELQIAEPSHASTALMRQIDLTISCNCNDVISTLLPCMTHLKRDIEIYIPTGVWVCIAQHQLHSHNPGKTERLAAPYLQPPLEWAVSFLRVNEDITGSSLSCGQCQE